MDGAQDILGKLHYLSVYASTLDFGGGRLIPTLQNSILGVWLTLTQAGFPPASLQDIASPHVDGMVIRDSGASEWVNRAVVRSIQTATGSGRKIHQRQRRSRQASMPL